MAVIALAMEKVKLWRQWLTVTQLFALSCCLSASWHRALESVTVIETSRAVVELLVALKPRYESSSSIAVTVGGALSLPCVAVRTVATHSCSRAGV